MGRASSSWAAIRTALVLGVAPDTKALLRAAADAARCPGLSALIVECWGNAPRSTLPPAGGWRWPPSNRA